MGWHRGLPLKALANPPPARPPPLPVHPLPAHGGVLVVPSAGRAALDKTRHEIELLIWAGLAFDVCSLADTNSASRLPIQILLLLVGV